MGVLQTGSALGGDGLTQVVYGCDGCEAKTGDMYARIAFVLRPEGGDEWDDSEIEGWTFIDAHCYCPDRRPDEEPPAA